MMGKVQVLIFTKGCQIVRLMLNTNFQIKKAQWRFCKGTLEKTSIEPFSFGTWYPSLDGRSDDPA